LGGAWIGWPGAGGADEAELERVLALHSSSAGYELKPVPISQSEVEGFYQGFCNEIIWPLLHDLQSRCNFVPDYWTNYVSVKQKLLMSRKQRRPAMRRLRNIVRTQDVYWWVKRFLGACGVVAGPHAGATLMLSEFAPAGRDDATPRAEASA
jgi:trehalose-6-phosphate synthase